MQIPTPLPGMGKDRLRMYIDNPVLWCREVCGCILDEWQAEILMAMFRGGEKKVSVRSGNGPGKTCLAALAGLYFLTTRPYATVVCTAPSQSQLVNGLWRECRYWYDRSPVLQQLLIFTATKIAVKGHEKRWYMVATTATISTESGVAEGLQGVHGDHILVIVDEASGVAEPVMSAIEGLLTQEDNIAFLIGNPTRCKGYFYETHTKFSHRWKTFHIDTEDLLKSGKSSRVTEDFIESVAERYGRDSAQYGIKVRGNFPKEDLDVWISEYDFERALSDYYIATPLGNVSVGWDIARKGADSTCRAIFIGRNLEKLTMFKNLRIDQISDKVEETKRVDLVTGHVINQYIDAIGMGVGVSDAFARDRTVHGVITTLNANDKSVFANYGSELAFLIKRGFEQGRLGINPKISNLKLLREDLCDRKLIISDTSGKTTLEPKDGFRKTHGHRSPDCGDAFLLGCEGFREELMLRQGRKARANPDMVLTEESRFQSVKSAFFIGRKRGSSRFAI